MMARHFLKRSDSERIERAEAIPSLFLERVAASPDRTAFRYPVADGWATISWRQMRERVQSIACGLRSLGLKNEDRCALLSSTRLEWILADLGILCAGGATTTIYPANTPEECAYILRDSQSLVAFVENEEQLRKLQGHRAELPGLKQVVILEGAPSPDGWPITLAQLEELGRLHHQREPTDFEAVARGVKKDALATLIYTSGTTGRPKGVELLHDCWIYEAEAIDALDILGPDDVQYLWLPLAHVFGKVLQTSQLRIGFVTAVDGRVDKLVENLAAIRPTFVAAVPRIFEKVRNRVVTSAQEGSAVKAAIFRWAMRVGAEWSRLERAGQVSGVALTLRSALADRLVFSKLRGRFGGRLRFFVSGSAPLSREVAEFFHAAGVLILEGYGLTESSAASFVNRPNQYRLGTVGPPLPGTEVQIARDDGEVLLRGRGIMRGYHGMKEATAEVLTPDGWLKTGDIGVLEDGFLRLIDRKKDLIKTSVGKYVAPQVFEGKLKAASPYVSHVLVHGDGRSFVTALVTLDPEAIRAWAAQNGLGHLSLKDLSGHERVRALVEDAVHRVNGELASYEQVKLFAILPEEWTVETGELTPSLKVKRKVVEQRYSSVLDGLYSQQRKTGTAAGG